LSSRRSESVSTMVFSMNIIILPFQLLQYTRHATSLGDSQSCAFSAEWRRRTCNSRQANLEDFCPARAKISAAQMPHAACAALFLVSSITGECAEKASYHLQAQSSCKKISIVTPLMIS
jgi:hypothetical protein